MAQNPCVAGQATGSHPPRPTLAHHLRSAVMLRAHQQQRNDPVVAQGQHEKPPPQGGEAVVPLQSPPHGRRCRGLLGRLAYSADRLCNQAHVPHMLKSGRGCRQCCTCHHAQRCAWPVPKGLSLAPTLRPTHQRSWHPPPRQGCWQSCLSVLWQPDGGAMREDRVCSSASAFPYGNRGQARHGV